MYQYKRSEQPFDNGNRDNVTINNSSSFKYQSNLLKGTTTRDVGANVDPGITNAHNREQILKLLCL